MDNLDFVKPIENVIINYYEDQKELIKKAQTISLNVLEQLIYFVSCLIHEGYSPEFHIQITIPAHKEVKIILPIIEDINKDYFGYYVDWNDGLMPVHNIYHHTYKSIAYEKTYNIKFFGMNIIGYGIGLGTIVSPEIYWNKEISELRNLQKYLTAVISFGMLGHKFISLKYAFFNCLNNFLVPNNLPPSITDISFMFEYCYRFNQPLENWDISNVQIMNSLFYNCTDFNQPLRLWKTSKIKNMSFIFGKCSNFNQSLDLWDTSNVIDMRYMFYSCYNFNQPLELWNVSNVRHMEAMFWYCKIFNQPLNSWDTSKVINMKYLFSCCFDFNQPLNNWNTSKVIDMNSTFFACKFFNQSLETWDVSNVRDTSDMFCGCSSFYQSVNKWNVKNLIIMKNMFGYCNSNFIMPHWFIKIN